MTSDEITIINYLKLYPQVFVAAKQIARKAGNRRLYDKNPGWPIPVLNQMFRAGLLETDNLGGYRLKPEEPKKHKHQPRLSPQMQELLKKSGKQFSGAGSEIDTDTGDAPPNPKPEAK